ncbi:hypothetical protein V8F06_006813 [Rhypophila decipiens]
MGRSTTTIYRVLGHALSGGRMSKHHRLTRRQGAPSMWAHDESVGWSHPCPVSALGDELGCRSLTKCAHNSYHHVLTRTVFTTAVSSPDSTNSLTQSSFQEPSETKHRAGEDPKKQHQYRPSRPETLMRRSEIYSWFPVQRPLTDLEVSMVKNAMQHEVHMSGGRGTRHVPTSTVDREAMWHTSESLQLPQHAYDYLGLTDDSMSTSSGLVPLTSAAAVHHPVMPVPPEDRPKTRSLALMQPLTDNTMSTNLLEVFHMGPSRNPTTTHHKLLGDLETRSCLRFVELRGTHRMGAMQKLFHSIQLET